MLFRRKKEPSLLSKFVWSGLLIGIICLFFSAVSKIFSVIGYLAFLIAGLALIANVIAKIFFNK